MKAKARFTNLQHTGTGATSVHRTNDTLASHTSAVVRAIDEMRQDPCAELDLTRLARVAAMSRFHFSRVFRNITGITPARFLAALRIEAAKHLLLHTSTPVTSVCLEVGYNSLGTFSRLFTEFVGANPTAFRRLRERLSRRTVDELIASFIARSHRPLSNAIYGSINAPADFAGVAFVGLFTSAIPKGSPLSGTLILQTGRFLLDNVGPANTRFALAVALPLAVDPLTYLLPSQRQVLVARLPVPPGDSSGRAVHLNLTLRPLDRLDPPVLTALPLLLATTQD